MKRYVIVLVLCVGAMFSCGGDKTTGGQEDGSADSLDTTSVNDSVDVAAVMEPPVPKAADELFDDFFFNFVANKSLQFSRIHFPLPEWRDGKTVIKQKSEWKMDRFFMNQGYYTLIFDNRKQMNLLKDTAVAHVVVEKIYLDKKWVKQYEFERENGLWMLRCVKHKSSWETMNASFIEFYHKFATDTWFQLESLHNPVAFTGPDPDDDFKQMDGVITPDTWLAFSPELPGKMIYNIIYGQNYRESDRKIFLIRGISNGLEIEMVFQRQNKHWKLVKLTT